MRGALEPFKRRFGLVTPRDMRRAYNLTFRTPQGTKYVLPDLAEHCHAGEAFPGGVTDPFVIGRWIGRHDVWLRIAQHLNLTEEELFAIYSGRSILKPEDFNRA